VFISLAALAAAFTLIGPDETTAVDTQCRVNGASPVPCRVAMAQEGQTIGLFFNISNTTIAFVGTPITDKKLGVTILGLDGKATPTDSGSCSFGTSTITCTASLGNATITVVAGPQ